MKTRIVIAATFFFALLSHAKNAQIMLEGRDMMTIPIEEAMKPELLKEHRDEFVDAAFETKRMDLLQLCWKTDYVAIRYKMNLEGMPDSPFRDQILLMMLRTESHDAWLDTLGLEDYLSLMQHGLAHWLIPLLKHRLPDLPVEFATISTSERRLKIAEDYEKAMAAAGVPIEGKSTLDHTKSADAREDTATSGLTSNALATDAHSKLSPQAPTNHADHASSLIPWIIGGGLATVLLFLVARRVLRL